MYKTIPDKRISLQPAAPGYAVGDTISLVQETHYSNFSGIPLNTAQLRSLEGAMSFCVWRIVDSLAAKFNAVSAHQDVEVTAGAGEVFPPIPDNTRSPFAVRFARDSAHNRLISETTVVFKQPGIYALVLNPINYHQTNAPCNESYEINQSVRYRGDIHLPLVQNMLIEGLLRFRATDGFVDALNTAGQTAFFFEVK